MIIRKYLLYSFQLAAVVQASLVRNKQGPYASNWLERLRKIKQLRQKIMTENTPARDTAEEQQAKTRRMRMEDFTEYT